MHDFNGVERWRRNFSVGDGVQPFGIAVHGTGIYIAGTTLTAVGESPQRDAGFVRRFDFKGNEVWTFVNTDIVWNAWDVAVDDSGIFFSGSTLGRTSRMVVGRLSFAEKQDWLRIMQGSDASITPIVRHNGLIITTSGNPRGDHGAYYIWLFDERGNLLSRFNAPHFLGASSSKLAADDSGIYLCNFSGLVAKFDYTGVELWRHQVPEVWSGGVIAVDAKAVYFAAATQFGTFGMPQLGKVGMLGLDAVQGNEIWRREWLKGVPNDIATRGGKVYVIGPSASRGYQSGFVMAAHKHRHYRNLSGLVTLTTQPEPFDRVNDGQGCKHFQTTKAMVETKVASQAPRPFQDLQFRVRQLVGPGNTLLVGDEWASQGSRFFVPRVGDYADGVLRPGESVDIPLTICQHGPYRFHFKLGIFGNESAAQTVE